mgnify:CR=1 FL=1
MRQRIESEPRVGDAARAPRHLSASNGVDVEADTSLAAAEHRVRAGGEILEPRADGQHDDRRRARERVRGGRTGDADRAQLQRMVPRERALAGLRLGDRHAVLFRRTRRNAPAASPYSTPPPAIDQRTLARCAAARRRASS